MAIDTRSSKNGHDPSRTKNATYPGISKVILEDLSHMTKHIDYRPLLDSLIDQAAIIHKSGEILATNRSWQFFSVQNNGTPECTDIGVNYLEVCKKSSLSDDNFALDAHQGILSVIKRKRERFELEYPCHSKSKKKWFVLRATPIVGEDSLTLILHTDITQRKLYELERKEAERLLQEQNEELQRINKELDNFVYRISHDLRAPIASSLGLIELMSHTKDADDTQDLLHMQKKSMLRMDGFIHDILDYYRNTRVQVEIAPIDVEGLIMELYDQFTYMEGCERIDFSMEVEGSDIFFSDRLRLTFIFNNLLSNAIRFYDPNKDSPFIKIKVTIDAAHAIISLSDNGIGIEEEHLERIFDMFYRGTNVRNGSGLGLYIVKESVKKLGGEIEVDSRYNVGTSVRLTLPAMGLSP